MASELPLRILIVDDERAGRQRLEDLLASTNDVELVDSVSTGAEAVTAIEERNPDLVFLDVQMPGLTGTDVVREVGPENMPAVIFVTAYDQYAVKAFELAALDYLLKPFDDERFEQAIERARKTIASRELEKLEDRLVTLLESKLHQPDPSPPPSSRYLERIAVDMRGQMRIVPVEQIDYITADGSYVELHTGDEAFYIREKMKSMEERLNPDDFFRIHRSIIVQLDRIERLLFKPGGDYAVQLHNGKRLKVSRGRYEELQQRLGLDSLR